MKRPQPSSTTPSQTPTHTPAQTPTQTPSQTPSQTPLQTPTQTSTQETLCEELMVKVIGPYPYPAPPGSRWVPNGWKLQQDSSTDFKTIFLDRIKPISNSKEKKKRTKIDLRGKVTMIFSARTRRRFNVHTTSITSE